MLSQLLAKAEYKDYPLHRLAIDTMLTGIVGRAHISVADRKLIDGHIVKWVHRLDKAARSNLDNTGSVMVRLRHVNTWRTIKWPRGLTRDCLTMPIVKKPTKPPWDAFNGQMVELRQGWRQSAHCSRLLDRIERGELNRQGRYGRAAAYRTQVTTPVCPQLDVLMDDDE